MAELREFWAPAGVEVELYDEGYGFLHVGGAEIAHVALLPELDPDANAAACYVQVPDADMWHSRLAAAGLPVSELRAEPWGMTEFSVEDPSGNSVRVGRNS
ncbi:MAG: hypothetical protein M3Z25_16820 [Actinomycetota bacterium]|nr:hypothetical protein [Actinomycetota bacterium]